MEVMFHVQILSSNSIENSPPQKKVFLPKIEEILSPESSEDQKKGLHRYYVLYSAGIWNSFVLTATFV